MRRPAVLLLGLLLGCGDDTAPQDAPAGSAWSQGPMLPRRRLEPGVAALGTNLVIVGGFDTTIVEGLHITDAIDVLDTTTDTWSAPLPPAPADT